MDTYVPVPGHVYEATTLCISGTLLSNLPLLYLYFSKHLNASIAVSSVVT